MSGHINFTLVAQMQDTMRAHGLRWAVHYYHKRLPRWEARFFLTVAYTSL